ncbi:MAG: hypothetical protein V7711_16045 [Pseudomonadales bacterium]
MRSFLKLTGFLLLLAISACSTDPAEKPEVKPLAATNAELTALYGFKKGDYRSQVFESQIAATHRELPLRIYSPSSEGHFPVLLFSHGNWSDNTKYDALLEHWVSHGYIVIAPYHLDGGGMARGIFNSLRYGQIGMIEERIKDMSAVLDQLELIAVDAGLSGKMDTANLAATGHSFGAFTAQQLIGARAYDTDTQTYRSYRDDRVKLALALSPPGPMFEVINENSWNEVNLPQLVTTGTWDSNPSFWPDWQAHLMSFDKAMAGQNFSLVVQGADHYLGNLICRPEREEAPQQDALNMVNSAAVTFLDANLKNNLLAQKQIKNSDISRISVQFAVLKRR